MATLAQTDLSLVNLELRDLRLHTADDLRDLLAAEAELWHSRLRWNYTAAIRLLKTYVDGRLLPGFLARDQRTHVPVGYCFAVYEGAKAIVGDLFSSGARATEANSALLRMLLPMLQNSPGVNRIESQLMLSDSGQHPEFEQAGFRAFPRVFLEADLPDLRELVPPGMPVYSTGESAPQLPPGLRLHAWQPAFYQPSADLVQRCYQGHGDAAINDQYRTVQGCLRFLHNIVRFPGCGVFSPRHSFVLQDERTGQLEGLLLTSLVEADGAHIPQLCISARRRRQGYGRLMMQHAATAMARDGLRHLTLTSTVSNSGALQLYRQLGFRDRFHYTAHVWTR